MRTAAALSDDLLTALTPDDIHLAFGIPPGADARQRLLDWFGVPNNATVGCIADCLGKGGARKLLRTVGLDADQKASSVALVEEWLRHREEKTLTPSARPHELAATLSELAAQMRTTPDKFDFVDVLVVRCTLLLRYIAFFYELAESTEQLSLEDLCALAGREAPVPREPYKAGDAPAVTLACERVRETLAALPALVCSVPDGERTHRARRVSDDVLALLEEWHLRPPQSIIPKGAMVDEFVTSRLGRRATCYDEFGLRVDVCGLRTTMEDGDNVLLAPAQEESVVAPRLEPLPRSAAWSTPDRKTCGLPETARPPQQRRIGRRVFLSYSHKDAAWAERVRIHLKPLWQEEIIELWDDHLIRAGEAWETKIETALRTSGVALLLVSPDFLASDYISNKELPLLLKAAKEEAAKVMPLFVRPVMLDIHRELAARQCLNSPDRPLEGLSLVEQDSVLNHLAGEILSLCRPRNRPL